MAADAGPGNRGPLLVAIDGIDGSGKTTLTAGLAAECARRGLRVAAHREPSDGPAGTLLRSLNQDEDRDPMMLALLSAADRYDQQARLASHEGALVISDRYYLSGLAYHAADGVSQLLYQRINAGVRRPCQYLFLDLDPAVAGARRRGRASDRWERAGRAALVPESYQAALQLVETTERAKVTHLDAAARPQDVLAQALLALAPVLAEPEGASSGRP